jgi:RNA polymerase sigma-70 factor (ECF subfamily)
VRIAVNESLKFLRTKDQHELLQPGYDIIDDSEDGLSVCDIPPDILRKMLNRLPTGYRTVLNLYVFEGKSHQEIARLLGIKKDSSASQFVRAKSMLAQMIRKYNNNNNSRR